MSSKLKRYSAVFLLLGACQSDPKQPNPAPPSKAPHGDIAPRPELFPPSLSTEDAAKKVLTDLMANEDPGLKVVAVRAWSGLTGAASDSELQKALYDKDPMVHTIAAAALARRGDLSGLPLLVEALSSQELNAAAGIVVTTLRHMNAKDATPALETCLTTGSPSLLASCATAFSFLGDKRGEEILRALLKSPITAADLAKNLRFLPEPVGLSMLEALFAQNNNYKNAQILALISVMGYKEGVDPSLRKALASSDPLLKGVAAALLLARGLDADPKLIAAAMTEPKSLEIFSLIGKRLKKPDPRILPAIQLVFRGPTEGLPFAFQVLQTLIENGVTISDLSALHAFLDAVPNLTGNAPTATSHPTSTSQATSKPAKLSEKEAAKLRATQGAAILAAGYLATLGDPRGIETMTKLLDWPNAAPAWIPAIEALQSAAAFPVVLLATKHESAEVRAATIRILVKAAKSGNPTALAAFIELGKDTAPEVRQLFLVNLSLLTKEQADPIARLALSDRLYAVRVTAAIAVLSRGMAPASQPDPD
jgi:HEAT repeat protein